jgi:paraquat-inducible protein B
MNKANPKVIGAFVLGAIALLIAAVVLFGKGRFFRSTVPVVMYFQGSVQGLQVGSAVSFRGVRVGVVTNIDLQYDLESKEFNIPVFAEIFTDNMTYVSGSRVVGERILGPGPDRRTRDLIDRGLRAQLSVPNFVTNQVNVTFDFFPGHTASFVLSQPSTPIEIPTIPSPVQEVTATLQNLFGKLSELPLDEMITEGRQLLSGATALVNDPQIRLMIADSRETIAMAKSAVAALDSRIAPILDNADVLSGAGRSVVNEANKMLKEAEAAFEQLDRTLVKTQTAIANLDRLSASANTLIGTANTLIEPGSSLTYELVTALREMASTARSARALMNTLDRDPNALIFGRPPAPVEGGRP